MKSNRPFWRRFWLALAAVLIGNAVYFAVQPYLPPQGQHYPFRIDLGLVLDSWVCLVIYSILLAIFRSKH